MGGGGFTKCSGGDYSGVMRRLQGHGSRAYVLGLGFRGLVVSKHRGAPI